MVIVIIGVAFWVDLQNRKRVPDLTGLRIRYPSGDD